MRLTAPGTRGQADPADSRCFGSRPTVPRSRTGGVVRSVLAAAFIVGFTLGLASPAGAHTGFEDSDPSDGEEVEGPVSEITIVFTGPAEPAEQGFEVLGESGVVRTPTDATTTDGSTWIVRFDPALEAGSVGVRWSVAAPDAHPISGSFSFTSLTGPSPDSGGQTATLETDRSSSTNTQTAEDLDSFLAPGDAAPNWAQRLGAFGRILTMIGTLLGVGALVFAVTALRGSRGDVSRVVYWIRRSGVMVLAGAGARLVAVLAAEGAGDLSKMWSPAVLVAVLWGSTGVTVVLRIVGGIGLIMGPKMVIAPADQVADPVISFREFTRVSSAAGNPGSRPDTFEPTGEDASPAEVSRSGEWTLRAADSYAAFLGAAVLLVSFAFNGHTVAKGNRAVMVAADILHVGAGAVWLGGVMMLTLLLWRRHRQGRDLGALPLVVRFSVVASLALVVVGVAGVAMAVMILDTPSQLWATPWGRLLLAKTVFVVFAAAGGAYNHRVLVPELERRQDEHTAQKLRSVVTAESAALLIVAVLTAFLVAAGT